MELREKIASLFAVARRAGAENKPGDPDDFAALVLAIPEIAEALRCKAVRDSKVGYERQG